MHAGVPLGRLGAPQMAPHGTGQHLHAGLDPFRARQLGITGRSIAPRLYVALALGGKFNHSVGVRGAGTIVAVNTDPDAPIFDWADVGLVGDWREIVPEFVAALEALRARS